MVRNMDFLDLISNGKSCGPGPQWATRLGPQWTGGDVHKGRAGAWGHRCSSAVAREGKEHEAELEAGSPEHEQRRDHGERRRWLKLSVRVGEGGEEVRWGLGVLSGLYRGSRRAEKATIGGNRGGGRAGLGGGFYPGIQGRGVKDCGGISRPGVGRRECARAEEGNGGTAGLATQGGMGTN
jgi:hypothetical protein